MKCCLRRIVSAIVCSIALLVFAFQSMAAPPLPSQGLFDELKSRIRANDDTVDTTLLSLEKFFAANPDDYNHSGFLNLKAYTYVLKQNYIAAYETLLEARDLAKTASNTIALAESYRLEGLILDFSGEHASALEALNRALALYNEAQSDRVLLVYSTMGNVYTSLKDYEKMLSFARQYLITAQRLNSRQDEGIAYFFQGYTQNTLGKYQDAKVSLLLAENLLREVQYPFISIVYNAMAELHIAQGNLAEALKRLNQATDADRQVGFRYNEGTYLLQLAEIYRQRGELELAITELKSGLDMDVVQNDKVVFLDILEQLILLSEATNDYRAALDYSKQYREVYKQSFNEQQSRLLALNRVRLAISEKEEMIKLLEKDNQLKEQRNLIQQKQNTYQLYFIVGVILSLVLVIGLLMRTRQQRKALDDLTQDLRKATKAKSDFLARMSHEIRTPLNAIIGLTKLSQRAAESQEQQTNLVQIEGASQTLLSVINDILDFSKIEAGKLDIESTQFNLSALVNRTVRLHLGRAHEKHIELIQHIARDVPLNLVGDPLRIQQVLSNLLSNALKFTEEGLVSVSVRCTSDDDKVLLEFEVKDTGIGLSSKQKAKLFRPFSQGDESISRRYGGSGLGLTICKQLTSLMGGEIWVESQLGKGASFYFTVVTERGRAQHSVSSPMDLSSLKVLIADDISVSRRAISEALSSANIKADIATGGQEAIAKLREATAYKKPYDVLILDFKMPDIDGLEVAAIMNQEFVKKKTKVIMLSAFESSQIREQAKQLGIHTFIKKPFDTHELIDKLQAFCHDIPHHALDSGIVHAPNLTGKKILFAEDNTLNQKVALGLLRDTHATIEVVSNGLEALDVLRKDNAFDIVLMDIQMPKMDGLAATRAIRNELCLTLPIIAMTAHAMQQDIEKSYEAGMNGHINKPVDPNAFFDVLVEALSEQKPAKTPELKRRSASSPTKTVAPYSLASVDKKKAMQALLNDEALYKVLLDDFIALQPELELLGKAIEERDYASVARIAHIYTTALKYIGAYALAELASSIEMVIQREEQEDTEGFVVRLELLYHELVQMNAKIRQHKP